MTKAQLERIEMLVVQLGWDEQHVRRVLGYRPLSHPGDCSWVLANSSILILEKSLGRSSKLEERGVARTHRPSTAKQQAYLRVLMERRKLVEEEVLRLVGMPSLEALSVKQASTLIDQLILGGLPEESSE